ncbi:MAG: hypothetical protein ABH858_05060, partial [Candidatus Omnitrophota bacterium]
AASTHRPEEKIILDIYRDLIDKFNIRLLIAPRHPERIVEIKKLIALYDFKSVPLSSLSQKAYRREDIFVLDTVGSLFYFYSLADLCFVGGSLVNKGGHNILEPLYFSKPTLFGPHMNNFKEIADIVVKYNAGIKVKDREDLRNRIVIFLESKPLRDDVAANCKKVFRCQKELLDSNAEVVLRWAG